jgi:hypothetical protein
MAVTGMAVRSGFRAGASDLERFWQRVRVGDNCWTWEGSAHTNNGYGQFTLSQSRRVVTHRAAWELTNGPIPEGLSVCHRCDNPKCVRPGHLFLGTHAENMADMGRKGRQRGPKGATHHKARLSEADVVDVRRRLAAGETQLAIGKMYNVHPTTIGYIARGKSWKHAASSL